MWDWRPTADTKDKRSKEHFSFRVVLFFSKNCPRKGGVMALFVTVIATATYEAKNNIPARIPHNSKLFMEICS